MLRFQKSTGCCAGHRISWSSQAETRMSGNVMMAASILLSGLTYSRVREVMDISETLFLSESTYYRIQTQQLYPAISRVYSCHRKTIMNNVLTQENVELIGNGRFDSRGSSATYGTYTLMDEKNDQIIDFFITHVSDVENSYHLEIHGLKSLLVKMENFGIDIKTLTTDQHIQIRSFLKKGYPTFGTPI